MPPVIPIVVAAAATYGTAAALTAATSLALSAAAIGAISGAAGAIAGSLAGSLIASQFSGGSGDQGTLAATAPQSQTLRGISTMTRESAGYRRFGYGLCVSSGVSIFEASSGGTDEQGNPDYNERYMLLAVVDHFVDRVIGFYIGDEFVSVSDIQNSEIQSGRYAHAVRLEWRDGQESQEAFTKLLVENLGWTQDDRCRGVFVVLATLRWDAELFRGGLPNIRVMFRGKQVFDPRTPSLEVDWIEFDAGLTAIINVSPNIHNMQAGDRFLFTGDCNATVIYPPGAGLTLGGEYYVVSVIDPYRFTFARAGTGEPIRVSNGGFGGAVTPLTWTNNPVLLCADYYLGRHGFGGMPGEIDMGDLPVQAGICEEQVTVPNEACSFTVTPAKDTLKTSRVGLFYDGDVVEISSTGELPGGLAPGQYYWIMLGPDLGGLATSYETAMRGQQVDITSTGSGTHTITRISSPRYALNGVIEMGREHRTIVEELLRACGGEVIEVAGRYYFRPAHYRPPVFAISEKNLRGAVTVDPAPGRFDLWNRVSGTHLSVQGGFTETDYSPVSDPAWVLQDGGEEVSKDVALPFTLDPIMAQRLAWIFAARSRQRIRVTLPCNLSTLGVAVGDCISLTLPEFGWNQKEFLVRSWTFGEDGPWVNLSLIEEAASSYDPRPAVWRDTAPNTTLVGPSQTPPPPNSLLLESGTGVLFIRPDGVIVSRIQVTWTPSHSAFVRSGGWCEVQYKPTISEQWIVAAVLPGAEGEYYITPVQDGTAYDVRVRSLTSFRVPSSWVDLIGHVVIGKTAPPTQVAAPTWEINSSRDSILISHPPISDADLRYYEYRVGTTWESGLVIASGSRIPGSTCRITPEIREYSGGYLWVAAVDVVGNVSTPTPSSTLWVWTAPAAPAQIRISDGVLRWEHTDNPAALAVAGYQVRYILGRYVSWEQGAWVTLAGGVVAGREVSAQGIPAGVVTVMVRAVDVSGGASDAGYSIIQSDPAAPGNIILTVDVHGDGFPGVELGEAAEIESGTGDLVTVDTGLYLPDDDGVYLPFPDDEYLSASFARFEYVYPFVVPVNGILGCGVGVDSQAYLIEMREHGSGLYLSNDADLYLPDDDSPYLGGPDPFASCHDINVLAGQLFEFRLTFLGGEHPSRCSAFAVELDAPDIQEELVGIALPAGGGRLPIFNTYNEISFVTTTIIADGGGARSVAVIDKDPQNGPLLIAHNTNGTSVAATIDVTLKGY